PTLPDSISPAFDRKSILRNTNFKRKESIHAPLPTSRTALDEITPNMQIPTEIHLNSPEMEVGRDSVACFESFTEIVEMVFPEHANRQDLGITFGGQIMRWMEYCGVMAAVRHTRSHLLTASFDSLNFLRPTRIGDIVVVRAIVSAAFTHSVEVYVTVQKEDLKSGSLELTNDGWVTMVGVDTDGCLIPVPKLITENDEEIARQMGSLERRERRLKERNYISKTA
ncbi:hypothetical protein HK096_001742, partial [Nowakowskiella sp. JEL0078]